MLKQELDEASLIGIAEFAILTQGHGKARGEKIVAFLLKRDFINFVEI